MLIFLSLKMQKLTTFVTKITPSLQHRRFYCLPKKTFVLSCTTPGVCKCLVEGRQCGGQNFKNQNVFIVYNSRRPMSKDSYGKKLEKSTASLKYKVKENVYYYSKKFNIWLEQVAPEAKVFVDNMSAGAKKTWSDFQVYRFVKKRVKVNPGASVTYNEEMKMYLLKRDLIKIAPLIPFCFVPFGFLLLTIPIYLFPRLLPHAFWNDQQRKLFYNQAHQGRLPHYKIVLHHMNYHKENHADTSFTDLLDRICTVINANHIPSNALLLQLKPICTFSTSPLNLEVRKVAVLLKSFSAITLGFSLLPETWLCNQLEAYGKLIIRLDQKLRSDHLLQKLSEKEIEIATLMRGLDCANLSMEANIYWLRNWLELTSNCNPNDYWFALHAMVLLSFNYSQVKFQRRVFG